jgi:hypothetical protein
MVENTGERLEHLHALLSQHLAYYDAHYGGLGEP